MKKQHANIIYTVLTCALFFVMLGCDKNYLPKPLGYNRLELPTHEYRSLPDSLPYTFEYSVHAKLLDDSSAYNERYWVQVYYPSLKSNVHITYKKVSSA